MPHARVVKPKRDEGRGSILHTPHAKPASGEQWEKVGNLMTQGEKRGRKTRGVECILPVVGTGGPVHRKIKQEYYFYQVGFGRRLKGVEGANRQPRHNRLR
eukprot:3880794-Pyramimonas_sp.AAC.1